MTKQELLDWAQAYYIWSSAEEEFSQFVAPGTYERRMWLCLFHWAGWKK
jgi:hypothetical protein